MLWVKHDIIYVLCLALLTGFAVNADAQSFSIKQYNISNGLPNTGTYVTCQDSNGYLWVGASSGLSRFDGRQFTNYSLTDGLPSLNISAIFQDGKGRLWIGTPAGMAQFINNRFVTYPTSDGLPVFYVFKFYETKKKQLWALTDKGIYEYSTGVWQKVVLYPPLPNHACREVVEYKNEWYINYDSAIVCYTASHQWVSKSVVQAGVSLFIGLQVADDRIIVGSFSQVFEIKNHQLISLYKPRRGRFSCIYVDSKQRLWITEDSSIKISEPHNWTHFSDSIPNKYEYIFNVNEDRYHNIWLSTRDGLLKIKDVPFTPLLQKNNSAFTGVYNMVPLYDGRLVFSLSKNEGWIVYDKNNYHSIPPPLNGKSYYYKDLIDAYTFDDTNSLWLVSRFKKFEHFAGDTLQDYSPSLHLATTEYIYDLQYIKRRKQFFICADSTLLYGSAQHLSTFIPRNTGKPIVKPTRVFELSNGMLLLYIDRHGVYQLDSANNLISLLQQTGIDGSNKGIQLGVLFYEDKQSYFWIAVPGLGLYEYGFRGDNNLYLRKHYTVDDGLQSNHIFSLTSDAGNRLWLATSAGVDILQTNKQGGWDIFNYAKADELAFTHFEFSKLITDKDGNVWLSSTDGIRMFHTPAVQLHKEAPRIIIEKVMLSFKETNWKSIADSVYGYYQLPYNPVLKYNQNSLGISFNAVDLSTSVSSPEYSYKLLPLDTSWSIPTKVKSVSFAQLPAGKYKFFIRAKDEASGWSEPAFFSFIIRPPFWDRWWFRLLVIALATYVVVTIFRNRIKKIRKDADISNQLKELEMKALKAQMNPHFIYNALNSIQALVANDKKEEGIHYIGSFSRLLRQVLDQSENNVISLDKELETLSLYVQLETLRLGMQLLYKEEIDSNTIAEFEKIPPLILQPFVENALWHGLSRKEGRKEIVIRIEAMEEWLVCEIEDNGIGRKTAAKWKSDSAFFHESKAIDITAKRLVDYNDDGTINPISFYDLHDENKNPSGTRVMVYIRRKLT